MESSDACKVMDPARGQLPVDAAAPGQGDKSINSVTTGAVNARSGEGLMLPPSGQAMGAPPPRFLPPAPPSAATRAMLPPPAMAPARSSADSAARTAAVSAAAAAASRALPAQRERAVAEAAAAAYASEKDLQDERASRSAEAGVDKTAGGGVTASDGSKPSGVAPPPRQPGTYQAPEWAGVPEGMEYTLEVMREGSILGSRSVAEKDHYTFGRTPENDIVLEHPSSSRLHAVLQFKVTTGEAFLYDAASAHGTFLNKKRLKPRVHTQIRVGDTFKLGRSNRLYIMGGPTELMPEEGLSKLQRQQMRILQAKEDRQEHEAQIGKAQMAAALQGGASWGFGEDAPLEDPALVGQPVDWREYAETKGLTEKQEKLAQKIRKKEHTMSCLQTESERINAKGSKDELTAGQASTLARNEDVIDRLKEEVDDLDETLNESIQDSVTGRTKAALDARAVAAERAKRKRKDLEDEEEAGSSDDDAFYDRTRQEGVAAAITLVGGKKAKKEVVAIDAATLSAQRETLHAEKAALVKRIEEEKLLAMEAELEAPKASGAEAADADALDAFMSNVETELENDKVGSLVRELDAVEVKLAATAKLLSVADPDGFFKAGSAAARSATLSAAQRLAAEKLRADAAAQERRLKQEARKREEEAQEFVPETEDDDQETDKAAPLPAVSANIHRLEADISDGAGFGLQIMQKATLMADSATTSVPALQAGRGVPSAVASSGLTSPDVSPAHVAALIHTTGVHPLALPGPTPGVPTIVTQGGLQSRQQVAKSGGRGGRRGGASGRGSGRVTPAADAEALVTASLARLSAARRGSAVTDDEQGVDVGTESSAVWQPPTDQKGDGRTAMNDALGY